MVIYNFFQTLSDNKFTLLICKPSIHNLLRIFCRDPFEIDKGIFHVFLHHKENRKDMYKRLYGILIVKTHICLFSFNFYIIMLSDNFVSFC